MKRTLGLALVFLLAAGTSVPVAAAKCKCKEGHAKGMAKTWQRLGVSAEVQKQIREAFEKFHATVVDLHKQIEEKQNAAWNALALEPVGKVEDAAKELAQLRAKGVEEHFSHLAKVAALLTPEQRAKWAEKMKSHGPKQKHKHHEGKCSCGH
jgi:Spy/CpxP family protein refolding chaperone